MSRPFNYQDYDDDSQIPRDDAGAVNMEWQWNQAIGAALSSFGIEGAVSSAATEGEGVEHAMMISRLEQEEETQKEDKFEADILRARGLVVKLMPDDGNCLFAAIADQVYGDAAFHHIVRHKCMALMVADRDHYSQFITEDFNDYIERKRMWGVYGNNLEIQAICELYARPVEVYSYDIVPMNTFQNHYEGVPIRISYHRGNHYNSLVDPATDTTFLVPTAEELSIEPLGQPIGDARCVEEDTSSLPGAMMEVEHQDVVSPAAPPPTASTSPSVHQLTDCPNAGSFQ